MSGPDNSEHKRGENYPVRYFDRHFGIEAAKILPGEYFATDKNMVLVTVLGSCVTACLSTSTPRMRWSSW